MIDASHDPFEKNVAITKRVVDAAHAKGISVEAELGMLGGVEEPARVFKPAHFRKGGPGVVFVHGAGYLQNVDRWWSANYYREYLFDHLLMERGFIVIDVDHRGAPLA